VNIWKSQKIIAQNSCALRTYNSLVWRQQEIPHSHHNLHLANTVSIAFIFEKNDEHDATITQHHTFDNKICPVKR
jgi:hypothetical protein